MATTLDKKKEMWVEWTRDAADKYTPADGVDTTEKLVEDMADFTSDYASAMLDAFEKTFGEEERERKPSRRKRDED